MFWKEIELTDEHYNIIRQLSKETDFERQGIGYLLIEMGIATLISSRKIAVDGRDGLQMVIDELSKKISEDENFLQLSQLLEKYYDAGTTKKINSNNGNIRNL